MTRLQVFYKPDNYPDWIPWRDFVNRFNMIGTASALGMSGLPSAQPGFHPRISFGKPPDDCDNLSTERRLRRGFQFQIKFTGIGHVVIDRFRIHGQKLVEKSRGAC